MAYLWTPKVNKGELEKYISRHYKLGRILNYKKLEKGFANCLYRFQTTKGYFTFKIAIRHNSSKLKYEIDLLNNIANLPTPKPIKTKSGKYVFNYKGYLSFVYPYLPGNEQKRFNYKMLFQIGEFLGKLHLQTNNFNSKINRTKFYFYSPQEIKRVLKESKNIKNRKIKQALQYIKSNAMDYKLPRGLPSGAIHIDVKPENVLFQKNKLSGVVDFDNSFTGPLLFDLVNTLMWFSCKKGKINWTDAKEIYRGYTNVRKLSSLERQHLSLVFHNIFYGITLSCIDQMNKGKFPEKYLIYLIDNLFVSEKNLNEKEIGSMLNF